MTVRKWQSALQPPSRGGLAGQARLLFFHKLVELKKERSSGALEVCAMGGARRARGTRLLKVHNLHRRITANCDVNAVQIKTCATF